MIKRVWASYGTLGYRAWERYLDKMAREGWQLRSYGFLGMRFAQAEPRECYHRILAKPKKDETPRLAKGERLICDLYDQTIVASDTPKTTAEELAQDEAMRPIVHRAMRGALKSLIVLTGWCFLFFMIATQEDVRAAFWSMLGSTFGVILFVVTSLYMLGSMIVDLLNIFRYYQAKSDQRIFEAILQDGKWPVVRKTAGFIAIFILTYIIICAYRM